MDSREQGLLEGMGTGLIMLACERELIGGSHGFDLGRYKFTAALEGLARHLSHKTL